MAIFRKPADEAPAVTDFLGSMAQCQNNFGRLLSMTDRPREADTEYRAALAIRREVADREPAVPENSNDLASGHTNLADLVRSLGRFAEARDGYERAIALREALTVEVPKVAEYRSHLAYSLRRRGLAGRDLGDAAGASADTRRSLGLYDGLESRSGEEWHETACCQAALTGLDGLAGSGPSAGSGPDEADRAMDLLRRAVAMGDRGPDAYRTEAALGPLHDRDDFRLMMMDLAFPAEPFAHHD